MNINDRKILYAIDSFLPKDKFVIFPYGRWGKRAQYLLNKKYGINEVAIVDNKLSEKDKGIISINDISQIEGDYVVLFATENISVRKELSTAFMNFQGHPVCDIASLEIRNDIYFSMQCDRLYIEDCDEKQKDAVFAMTKQTWTQLGKTQPYWSVLTDKKYLIENMDDKRLQEFYNSGAGSCNMIVQTLIRNQVIQDKSEAKNLDITEIGCGTGRVTKHLANTFRSVNAVDISAGNVEIAKRMVSAGNVLFHVYEDIYEYSNLPKHFYILSCFPIVNIPHNPLMNRMVYFPAHQSLINVANAINVQIFIANIPDKPIHACIDRSHLFSSFVKPIIILCILQFFHNKCCRKIILSAQCILVYFHRYAATLTGNLKDLFLRKQMHFHSPPA